MVLLEAENDLVAACMLRGIMATGKDVTVHLYAATFRWSKRVVENLANHEGWECRRDVDSVTAEFRGNRVVAYPVGDGCKARGRSRGDVCVILLTEAMPKDVVDLIRSGAAAVAG